MTERVRYARRSAGLVSARTSASTSENVSGLIGIGHRQQANAERLEPPWPDDDRARRDESRDDSQDDQNPPRERPVVDVRVAAIAHEDGAGEHQQRDRQPGKQLPFRTSKHFEPSPERDVIGRVEQARHVGAEIPDGAEIAREAERRVNRAIAQQERQHRNRGNHPRERRSPETVSGRDHGLANHRIHKPTNTLKNSR